jgi:hypothetical protein
VAKKWMSDIGWFSRLVVRRPLHDYELRPARAIVDSILKGRGDTFVVAMSRQAGKNETAAQVEAYLLNLFQRRGGFIVKAAPTHQPQLITSRMRLQDCMRNPWNRGAKAEHGHILRYGNARIAFFSAAPRANVVGATASILLECDEAQDVVPHKWEKDFRPMGAYTNVTTVLWGTVWTSKTLLAKTARALLERERKDGVKRVFYVPWPEVARENPAYGRYVRAEIDRLGRHHPLIRTQYFLEEIDDEGGMFPESRRVQMRGDHRRRRQPEPAKRYACLIDVAGEEPEPEGDEALMAASRRDATALTVVEVDASTVSDALILKPTYRVMDRRLWVGTRHSQLYASLLDLCRNVWGARWVVVDATGVGAGLASFLSAALKDRVTKFQFNARTKSELGWDFLAICDTGRFKDHLDDGSPERAQFWREVDACSYQVQEGPGKRLRWGVDDPAVHDDALMSAALVAVIDRLEWKPYSHGVILESKLDYDDGRF